MMTLDFYIQQIVVIFLVLNLKNYCYFKFRDTILLYIDAIMDLIYTIVIYIVYGIFQIIFILKNKKINKKMIKITWIIEIIIFIIWLIFNR